VTQYQYTGELGTGSRLQALRQCLPQRDLPPTVLEAIWAEVDTRHRLRKSVGPLGDRGGKGGGHRGQADIASHLRLLP
jgi:hypothetical protein